MSASKMILKGLIAAATTYVFSVWLPIYLFSQLNTMDLGALSGIGPADLDRFKYWITAIGMLTVAFTFFSASAPVNTGRKALFSIILTLLGALYFYIFSFSGVTDLSVPLPLGTIQGTLFIDIRLILVAAMGVIMLNVFLGLYDLIIAIIAPIQNENNIASTRRM